MPVRFLGASLLAAFSFCAIALAQGNFPTLKPTTSLVTILSDAVGEPDSPVSSFLNDISITLDKDANVRVLAVAGYGGEANVRDLLQLRGADLAVLNNDVIGYLDLAQTGGDARRKVRAVLPLFSQTIYLFAKKPIDSLSALSGKRVAYLANKPSRFITAKTIFGVLKVNATLSAVDPASLPKLGNPDFDAILLYEADLPAFRTMNLGADAFSLIPIPSTPALEKVYAPVKVAQTALGPYASSGDLATLQVTTFLATFDWAERQARYPDVLRFLQKLFALRPDIEARRKGAFPAWADPRMTIPGWTRYSPAEPFIAVIPPAKRTDQPRFVLALPDASQKGNPQQSNQAGALKLIANLRPPLVDAQSNGGGVVMKLFADAIGAKGMPLSVTYENDEKAILTRLLDQGDAEAMLFVEAPTCDAPQNLSALDANLCDRAALSESIMSIIARYFTRAENSATFTDTAPDKVICVPGNHSLPQQPAGAQASGATPRLMRARSIIDCIAAVDAREADAFVALEPEARFVLDKLKLSESIKMVAAPAGVFNVVAALPKDAPRTKELLPLINKAIVDYKATGGYASTIVAHLAELAGMPAPTQR